VTDNVTDAAANMKKALSKTSFINKQVLNGIISDYNTQTENTCLIIDEELEEAQVENQTLNQIPNPQLRLLQTVLNMMGLIFF
jgi:hypothetical protein